MGKFLSRLGSPAGVIFLFLIITQGIKGAYMAREAEPPPAFTLLCALGMLWVVGWWMRLDSIKRGIGWAFDMGLFLYIAWIFVMPYYLLKTRGAKGLLIILASIVAYIGALMAGGALYILLTP